MTRKHLLAAVLILLFVAACQPPAGTPQPTVWAIRIQYSSSLEPVLKDLTACATKQPGIGLVTHQLPASQLDPSKADLTLRLGNPAGFSGFSTAIGDDELVLIVHPSNLLTALQLKDVPGIFSGQIRDWDELTDQQVQSTATRQPAPVHAWRYYPGEDVETALESIFPAGAEISDRLAQAPGPRQMVEAVAADPNAIGFIPTSFVIPSVRVIRFASPPAAPRLALSSTEPQGPARALVACLQGQP